MSYRVAVLISGRGSNLRALIDQQAIDGYAISGVISSRADAAGLAIAAAAAIETAAIERGDFADRTAFDKALQRQLDHWQPDLIVLAGFMHVLGGDFVERYLGRLINIHPSLLPQFPGLNTHERALQAGVQTHGASVHFVTPELDGGPVIAQTQLTIEPGDTPQTLADRLLPLEHRLLAEVVRLFAAGRLNYQKEKVLLDGEIIDQALLV